MMGGKSSKMRKHAAPVKNKAQVTIETLILVYLTKAMKIEREYNHLNSRLQKIEVDVCELWATKFESQDVDSMSVQMSNRGQNNYARAIHLAAAQSMIPDTNENEYAMLEPQPE